VGQIREPTSQRVPGGCRSLQQTDPQTLTAQPPRQPQTNRAITCKHL
jgi:hypothetical protein